MAKLVNSINNGPFVEPDDDQTILSLKSRIETLIQEILKLSDISNEALKNNIMWHKKYNKLKELYLKNISDELTLEDLISGKIQTNPIEITASKSAKSEKEQLLEELAMKTKELEAELVKGQEELGALKVQWGKIEMTESEPSEIKVEKKYQAKISQIEEEIRQIKKENKEREGNVQNYDKLAADFSRLAEEKKKMEAFYQKKIKDLDAEVRKKKNALPPAPKNEIPIENKEIPVNPVNFSINNTINNPGTGAFPPVTFNNLANINNLPPPKNPPIENTQNQIVKKDKAFSELETIKEIHTNEKIEEANREENPEKKLQIIEENQGSKRKISSSNPPNIQNTGNPNMNVSGKKQGGLSGPKGPIPNKKDLKVKKTGKK